MQSGTAELSIELGSLRLFLMVLSERSHDNLPMPRTWLALEGPYQVGGDPSTIKSTRLRLYTFSGDETVNAARIKRQAVS